MPTFRCALDVALAIREKKVSPVEVLKEYLKVCDQKNGALNAFVWRRDEAALVDAMAAESAVIRGDKLPIFHGVPLPIKDLTEVQGEPVTHGSRCAAHKIGRQDSSVIRFFKEAGFVPMGRTNSPEFGALPVTENALFGATRNPWNTSRTPGGSSGGASAAVAAGMAPIAHASDGGGSIRIPAACCGLVGLKASRGRIPKGPWASDIMHGFSVDGCVSTTVADTAAVLDVICRHDPTAWYSVPNPPKPFLDVLKTRAPRLRIGYTTRGPVPVALDQSAIDAVTKTATLLAELGHQVEEVRVDWPLSPEQLLKDFIAVWCTATGYVDLNDWSQLEPINHGLRQMGLAQNSLDYVGAVLRLQVFSRKIVSNWESQYDLLLTPTLAIEPPNIGWMYEKGDTDPTALLMRACEMVPYTSWINITGQPAIALPTYVAPSGLPMGVQLVAQHLREDLLLQVGQELEDALCWVETLPF
jgi:amidase